MYTKFLYNFEFILMLIPVIVFFFSYIFYELSKNRNPKFIYKRAYETIDDKEKWKERNKLISNRLFKLGLIMLIIPCPIYVIYFEILKMTSMLLSAYIIIGIDILLIIYNCIKIKILLEKRNLK